MGIHPAFKTAANEIWDNDLEENIQPLTIIRTNGAVALGVVLMGPIFIPQLKATLTSQQAAKPLDIKNADEWQETFKAYIVYDLVDSNYTIISASDQIQILEEDPLNTDIPYEFGLFKLREALGMIKLAQSMDGKYDLTGFFKQLAENLPKE